MFPSRLMCSWIVTLGLAAEAFCQTYVPINLGYSTLPATINEAGAVAGRYTEQASTPPGPPKPTYGFVQDAAGVITRINLGGGLTYVDSINAAGATTGSSYLTSGFLGAQGFVRDPAGNFTFFDVPTGTYTLPASINAGGAVTGFSGNYGFLRDADGTITSFQVPGSIITAPVSINAVGTITGYSQIGNAINGFVRDPSGNITTFAPAGSTDTSPTGINYAGAITGWYVGANGRDYGFVRDADGTITSFDPGFNTLPTSINSKGVITGYYTDSANNPGPGFVRSPDGTITLLDPPNFCGGYVHPTSINEAGVITGSCSVANGSIVGWVRFP